ncbi:hypothetical protein KW794_00580 [Candidatus Saccharibacteria bacterium]|nr:hypothetical protein [Candidatus Saccharibacteria bacterium]
MPVRSAEVLREDELEPIFAEIEPVRQDIMVIRGIVRSISHDRMVRLQKTTPISRIEIATGKVTESSNSNYIADMSRPRGDQDQYLLVGTAVWTPNFDGTLRLNDIGRLRHFKREELGEYATPEQFFENYDRQEKSYLSYSHLRGWMNPDIHTPEGMYELATILNQEGEVVDDKKAEK